MSASSDSAASAAHSAASAVPNPLAPHHLPWFITGPGETDGLLVGMIVFLILVIVGVGNLYFKLHALPEHRAHRAHKVQMEVVSVLCILALFTHNHAFWIVALLLALVDLPDFSTPLNSMSDSLARLSGGSGSWSRETGLLAAPALEANPAALERRSENVADAEEIRPHSEFIAGPPPTSEAEPTPTHGSPAREAPKTSARSKDTGRA